MADHPNAELVRSLAEARQRLDIDTLRGLVAEDATWHLHTGDVEGIDAIVGFWKQVADVGAAVAFDVHDVVGNDEHAIALIDNTMQRPGKDELSMRQVWIFHVADGKVTDAWFWNEDDAKAQAYWA